MAVTVKGLSRLQAKLDRLDPLTRAAVTRAVGQAGALVEGAAKLTVPVDSGDLRRSIRSDAKATASGAEAEIGTSMEYAAYVEFGTSRIQAQPYLKPALQKNKQKARKLIITEIVKAHKGL